MARRDAVKQVVENGYVIMETVQKLAYDEQSEIEKEIREEYQSILNELKKRG